MTLNVKSEQLRNKCYNVLGKNVQNVQLRIEYAIFKAFLFSDT